MKRKFALIFIAALVALLAICAFVACDPNGEDVMAVLTFNRGGIGDDVTLSHPAGTDISSELPTPNNTQAYYFGGWFESDDFSGEAVSLPDKMPKENKTYYARWYRKYSVSVLIEQADGTFVKSDELSFADEANRGKDSFEADVETPSGYVDVNASKTFSLEKRDSEFELRYELETFKLTLDKGGEGENEEITAKRTTDISDKLSDIGDTEGYYFGGWYADANFETSVADLTSMPSANAKYFARWYRKYKVAAYAQNADHSAFELAEEREFEANKGDESVSVKASMFEDFASYIQPDDVELTVSSKDGTVCELRYARDDVKITFQIGELGDDIVYYTHRGTPFEFALPKAAATELLLAGYRAEHFALDGETVVSTDANEDVTVSVFFEEALEERNGSDDKLFLPKNEPGKAYLAREGFGELEGTYNEETHIFSVANGRITGKVYDDGTFATQREGAIPFYLYDPIADAIEDGVVLSLDWLDGAELEISAAGANKIGTTYEATGGEVKTVFLPEGKYTGTFRYDLQFGDCYVTIPVDGVECELNFHFLFGEYEAKDGTTHDVFQMRGMEFGCYEDDLALIFFDGYGTARYIVGDAYMLGEYGFIDSDEEIGDETEFIAVFPTGDVHFLMNEFTSFENGVPYQQIYRFDGISGTFSEENIFAEGGTGAYGELYVSGYGFVLLGNSQSKKRYDYEIQLGGMLMPYGMNWIKLYDPDTKAYVEDIFFNSQYGYYFKMGTGAELKFVVDFKMPARVIYFEGNGIIHVFEYDDTFETLMYERLDGVISDTGNKTADGRDIFAATFEDEPDKNFEYFEMATDGITTCYLVGVLVYNDTYTAKDGSTLMLDGYGNGTFIGTDGIEHFGAYYSFYEDDDCLTFLCDDDNCTLYFDFNIVEGGFEIVEYTELPQTLYHFVIITENGVSELRYNAIMTVNGLEAEIEAPVTMTSSVVINGTISLYDPIYGYYAFTVSKVSMQYDDAFIKAISTDFKFNLVAYNTQDGYVYGFALSDGFEKTYDLEDGSSFRMDGFGTATYIDADGEKHFGAYDVLHETTSVDGVAHRHYIFDFIDVNDEEFLFDLWDDGSLTRRGDEYSWYGYYIFDGENYYNYMIFPDGNGNLDFVYYNEGMLYMATAKYTLHGNIGVMTDVEYTHWVVMEGFTEEECAVLNALAVWLQEEFEIYEGETYAFKLLVYDDQDCFMMLDEDASGVFAFNDLSALVLDGFNEAEYIDSAGDSHHGTYVVENYSADEGASIMKLIRYTSNSLGELAFLLTDAANIKVGTEFGNYYSNDDSLFFDGLDSVTYIAGEEVKEGKYTFDLKHFVADISLDDGTTFKVKLIRNGAGNSFVVCEEELAGQYSEVDMQDEPVQDGAALTMDGMGGAELLEGGVLTRYSVLHLELTVYRLTNLLDSNDSIDVKLDLDKKTFKRSDGQMLMPETQWFDFAGSGQVVPQIIMSIDSFYIVRLNGEVIGVVETYEQFDVNSTLYHVVLSDGTKTSYVRSLSGHFPNEYGGFYGYAYMEYDEKSHITLEDADGRETPIELTGYGLADINGIHYNYRTAVYWFDGETLCVAGVYDNPNQNGYKMYSVNFETRQYTSMGDRDKSHFTVENGVLTAYTGKAVKIIFPEDMGIKEIGEGVFSYATLGYYVLSVNLSDVVEVIGKRAFYPEKANSMTADTICEVIGTAKLRIIREEAFYLADIKSLELPAIELVETKAFYGATKLIELVLGNNAQSWSLGQFAFGCGHNIHITITAPHAPLLGENAFNKADVAVSNDKSNYKYIKFTSATAWAEAQDANTDIGASWVQYFAETALTYNLSGPDAASVSFQASAPTLYFEDKRAA